MRKLMPVAVLLSLLIAAVSYAGQGKVRISADREGAYVYVNGKKKAMIGEGYTTILLEEGEYEIMVEQETDDGNYVFRGKKTVFVGEDVSVKFDIKMSKIPTEQKLKADAEKERKKKIAAEEKKRKERLVAAERKKKEQARKKARAKIVGKTVQDSKFVLIQPGTFMMGSPADEPERRSDETQHKVTLTKPFYMQATEVTQGQWKAVIGNNPSKFKDCGDDCPVEQVSWNDVQEFIKKLNRMTGKKYRLPTEAEWEYAARAGTTTPFYTGKCLDTDQANYDGDRPMPDCAKGKDRKKTMSVASFSPNALGLYDMHGNVWEWCSDRKGDYPTGAVTDPAGPDNGGRRVLRGGSWNYFARYCRSAFRNNIAPDVRVSSVGFRVVVSFRAQ